MVVILPVLRYKCLLSSRNSVSPPSASAIADSVMGNGLSGLTGPITSPVEICTSWPCSRSVAVTVPLRTTLDSIRAPASSSKTESPTSSLLITHWTVPVESLRTTKRILFDPLDLWTHPLSSTSAPSWDPERTSPIQYDLAMSRPPIPSYSKFG